MRKLEKHLIGTALSAVLIASPLALAYAGFEEAVEAYEAGDYKKAHDEWLPLAEDKDPAAMRNLGHLYRRGLGVEQDYAKALVWYKRAAEMGFDRAQANVGTMYLKGQGVPQDYVEAAEWFTKAARNGHTIAQYNLGVMHEFGKGVEKSKTKALAWYNLAAKAGHKQALNKLSILVAGEPDVQTKDAQKSGNSPAKPSVTAKTPKTQPNPAPVIKPAEKKEAKPAPAPIAPKVAKKTEKPALAETAKPDPLVKEKVAAPAVKQPEVAVKAEPAETTEVKTASAPKANKFDPFAGSSNKLPDTGNTGAPTVFSQKAEVKAVEASPAPEKTVTVSPAAPAPAVASVTKDRDVAAKEAVNAGTSSEQSSTKGVGFFTALKSLIIGDDEEQESTENAATLPAQPNSAASKKSVASIPQKETVAKREIVQAPRPEEKKPSPVIAKVSEAPEKPVQAPVMSKVTVPGAGLTLAEKLEMADLAFTLEEYQQALSVWAPLAQGGNAQAQYNLGKMFNEGYAVPIDRVRAYYWWQKAKTNGNPQAAASLAKLEASLTFLEKRQIKSIN
ncbi:MAG: hypothetical protein MI743_05645 [Sneathiellales bacterium]|nr:hypothetical protein [Sneathiellales bacterium]